MSDVTVKMVLANADRLVQQIFEVLRPGCDRLQVAGSIRRRDAHVGDIEMVAIAKDNEGGLFGVNPEAPTQLDVVLGEQVEAERIRIDKNGPKYKRCWLTKSERWLDLFIVKPETWGVLLAIRTGPAALSKAMVTQQHKGGLLENGLSVADGRVWRGRVTEDLPEGVTRKPAVLEQGELVPIESEEHFFSLMSCGWLEPHQRTTWSTKHLTRGQRY